MYFVINFYIMHLVCWLCISFWLFIPTSHCGWITLTGPASITNENNAISFNAIALSTNVEKYSNRIDDSNNQHYSIDEKCCEYQDSEKQIEESLRNISETMNDEEILDRIYSLIDDIPVSIQKVVDDLTFAVFIPESKEQQNDNEDLIWEYKEESSSDESEICISMKHEIVNVMERRDMYFKLALLKHNIPENFKTKSKLEYEHGPFIIVKTESDQEISIGFSVFQYKISKRQLKYPKAKWTCEFWNKESYSWEIRGIATFNTDNHITCISDHLSAFSIVMDPYSAYDENAYSELLTIFSTIGSLMTIPCLMTTVMMYRHNRTRREKISSKILIYCCVSLLLLHFSFLLFTFFRNILPCWFLNFILHYGGSSSLLWIAADGINMWRKLFVDVFDKRKHVFFHWSKIFSWGFPLFSSVIGVVVTDYSNIVCQIGFEYNMPLYIIPCTLILIANATFFTIMFVNVVCKDRIRSLSGKKKKYVMSLVQVFGLFWCISFPLLWLPETRILGHIVFTIFISNQGIFIFYIRCVNEREIRRELLRYIFYKRAFHKVLNISHDRNLRKSDKTELTGIFSISSTNTSFLSFSECNA